MKLLPILLCLLIFSCDETTITQEKTGKSIDVTTMATPKGEKLRPAEKGPVRSALGQPDIDLNIFRLSAGGLVESPFSLTWQEIQDLNAVYSDTILMYCVEGWEVWGNWKGILVEELLEKSSLKNDATHVFFHCADGYTTALPLAYIRKYGVMLAYEVNGKPLEDYDGFPLRVIAFGKLGYKWAKWVNRLEIIDTTKPGFWENYGYTDKADVPLSRRRYYEGENVKAIEW